MDSSGLQSVTFVGLILGCKDLRLISSFFPWVVRKFMLEQVHEQHQIRIHIQGERDDRMQGYKDMSLDKLGKAMQVRTRVGLILNSLRLKERE